MEDTTERDVPFTPPAEHKPSIFETGMRFMEEDLGRVPPGSIVVLGQKAGNVKRAGVAIRGKDGKLSVGGSIAWTDTVNAITVGGVYKFGS